MSVNSTKYKFIGSSLLTPLRQETYVHPKDTISHRLKYEDITGYSGPAGDRRISLGDQASYTYAQLNNTSKLLNWMEELWEKRVKPEEIIKLDRDNCILIHPSGDGFSTLSSNLRSPDKNIFATVVQKGPNNDLIVARHRYVNPQSTPNGFDRVVDNSAGYLNYLSLTSQRLRTSNHSWDTAEQVEELKKIHDERQKLASFFDSRCHSYFQFARFGEGTVKTSQIYLDSWGKLLNFEHHAGVGLEYAMHGEIGRIQAIATSSIWLGNRKENKASHVVEILGNSTKQTIGEISDCTLREIGLLQRSGVSTNLESSLNDLARMVFYASRSLLGIQKVEHIIRENLGNNTKTKVIDKGNYKVVPL